MRLVQTNSKKRSEHGNHSNFSADSRPLDLSLSKSRNIVDGVLNGKSVMMLSSAHSEGSSLDIKVLGGGKKTTPPSTKKESMNKSSVRSKRRRSSSSHDFDENDNQIYESERDGENFISEGGSNNKKKTSGEKLGKSREKSKMEGRGEDTKHYRKKYYDDKTYSSRGTHQTWSNGIGGFDNPNDLQVPVGQWIAILCAVIGIAYHYFNIGQKIPKLLKGSKVEKSLRRKENFGKKTHNASKRGKKRGSGANAKKTKTAYSKEIHNTLNSGAFSQDIEQSNTNTFLEVFLSKFGVKKTEEMYSEIDIDSIREKQSEKKKSKITGIKMNEAQKKNAKKFVTSKPKRKKKAKKNNKMDKNTPKEDTNSPDSVSTDGSSSTEEVDNSYVFEHDASIEGLGYVEKLHEEGEWTVVGAVSSKRSAILETSKQPSEEVSASPSHKDEEISEKMNEEVKATKATKSGKTSEESVVNEKKKKTYKKEGEKVTDTNINEEKKTEESTTIKKKSVSCDKEGEEVREFNTNEIEKIPENTSKLLNTPEKQDGTTDKDSNIITKEDNNNDNQADAVDIVKDDAEYARMLQKEEEELVAASIREQQEKRSEEVFWEKVCKKKRGKKF